MVVLAQLALVLSAVAGTLAAPAADFVGPAPQVREVGDAASTNDLPDFELGPHNHERRQDYTQNYKTGGNVNFSPGSNGYSVTFSGAGDFVVGKGWKKGSDRYD